MEKEEVKINLQAELLREMPKLCIS